jgi:glutamate-1-semialdehyde 2,1-aminomutase
MAPRLATTKSKQLYGRARRLIPGGVNSPIRSYPPYPLFVSSAKGSRFRSADGDDYLDYCMGYGALLDGHASDDVTKSLKTAIDKGTIYGQPTEQEVELAELITDMIPSIEMVRLSNSGTEATMHAVRLARGFTGRTRILKFEGGFHGSHDSLLVKRGTPGSPVGKPSSEGVPLISAKNTLIASYNDEITTEKILDDYGDELAAVIIEPVMGNMGPITPKPGFLETLRQSTREKDIVLIFDEVITGFRLAPGGAQEYYKVRPDITVLSKILGGGLPLSAFGGRQEIMEKVAPIGPVYQAGTFNGNPISVAAGLAMLESIKRRGNQLYTRLEKRGRKLRNEINEILESKNIPAQVNGIASMFQVFFTKRPVTDYYSAKSSDTGMYETYFRLLLASSVFVPPSQFETCFLSTAHSEADIALTLHAISSALATFSG